MCDFDVCTKDVIGPKWSHGTLLTLVVWILSRVYHTATILTEMYKEQAQNVKDTLFPMLIIG